MRPARLLLLLLVVISLGAFIYFYERHLPTTDDRVQARDTVFGGLEQESVQRLAIRNPAGRFELLRDGETWRLADPVSDLADVGAVSSLSWALANLKAERVLEFADFDPVTFGLAEPTLEVVFWTRDGREHSLRLGDPMPLGDSRAALIGDGRMVLVPGSIASELQRDLAAWRSTELVRVWEADVAALTLKGGGGLVQLSRSKGVWALEEPLHDFADRDQAQGILSDLSGARIQEFLDDPPPLSSLGLEPAQWDLTIIRRDDAPTVRLAFGAERVVDGERQVACRRDQQVVWVDQTAVKRFTSAVAPWRLARLLPFETWTVEALELEAAHETVALVRDGYRWKAGGVEVESDAVRDRLSALSQLAVRAFDAAVPEGEVAGKAKITTGEGLTLEVSFFRSPQQVVAVAAGRAGGMVVDRDAVDRVLQHVASLALPLVPDAEPTASQ